MWGLDDRREVGVTMVGRGSTVLEGRPDSVVGRINKIKERTKQEGKGFNKRCVIGLSGKI